MRDLYCIGEMVIDFIPGIEPGSYVRNAGGAPASGQKPPLKRVTC